MMGEKTSLTGSATFSMFTAAEHELENIRETLSGHVDFTVRITVQMESVTCSDERLSENLLWS